MKVSITFALLCFVLLVAGKKRRHIILILADDLGWNEVSWQNTKIKTPHLNALADAGVKLNRSYVSPKCSPSRAALLTGLYPFRTGMQRGGIQRWQPVGLNTSVKILPQMLKEGGYKTHMVGKWHLGYCHEDYLPTKRGFDTFFGQYNHVTDYYTRNFTDDKIYPGGSIHDLHDGLEPSFEGEGVFSTDLYSRKAEQLIMQHNSSEPLFLYLAYQAPHMPLVEPPRKYLSLYKKTNQIYQHHLRGSQQATARLRAATITALDAGVGQVVKALKRSGLYDDSIIVFSSDNGGVAGFSNFPLKGEKERLYEGGVRAVGFVHSPLIKSPGTIANSLMYISDWPATLLSAVGKKSYLPPGLDSYNMWPTISRGKKGKRKEIILNLDENSRKGTRSAAILSGNYKYILGQKYLLKQKYPQDYDAEELYNLKNDPNERKDLLKLKRNIKQRNLLKKKLLHLLKKEMEPAFYPVKKPVEESNPGRYGGVLSPGWCKKRT